jgi:hypothetical protein
MVVLTQRRLKSSVLASAALLPGQACSVAKAQPLFTCCLLDCQWWCRQLTASDACCDWPAISLVLDNDVDGVNDACSNAVSTSNVTVQTGS